MAAPNNNNTQMPGQENPVNPSTNTIHQAPSSHGYYYATPHQLYPYMSLFYSNIATHPIKNEQENPPQTQPIHPSVIWTQRNNKNKNKTISPIPPPPQDSITAKTQSEFSNTGYWDLPPITYGPLASNNTIPSPPKQPRIGAKYQAEIPSTITDQKQPKLHDECVWECHKVSPISLNKYLRIVQFVLGTSKLSVYTDCHYDEESALYLLKLHNYNINDTIHTLTLHKPSKNNHNFAWLFNQNKSTNKNRKINYKEEADDQDQEESEQEILYEYSNRTMSIIGSQQDNNNGDTSCSDDDYDDEDYCFSCGDGGNLLICDKDKCLKVWHIHCAGLLKMPTEEQWYCPSHICCICAAKSMNKYQCSYCGNAYCGQSCCPLECIEYEYHDIEFLCQICLSQMNNFNEDEDADDCVYKFASERFMQRLLELHKRKRNMNMNNMKGSKSKSKKSMKSMKNMMPMCCKLGRNEVEWFDLYCAVISCGGLSKVKDLSAWDGIRKKCELNQHFKSENIWKSLRDSYIEYLYCYEKQYFPETSHVLPRGIQAIVDNKGALDGLFVSGGDDGGDDGTQENVEEMVIDVD